MNRNVIGGKLAMMRIPTKSFKESLILIPITSSNNNIASGQSRSMSHRSVTFYPNFVMKSQNKFYYSANA